MGKVADLSEKRLEPRGGKDVSPRQEPDGQRFEREIMVFPALAQTYTKKDSGHDLDACFGESVDGTEWKTQSRP